MNIIIRLAVASDASAIASIGYESFQDTFRHLFLKETDLIAHLNKHFNAEAIAADLRINNIKYFIALCDGKPAGFAKIIHDSKPSMINNSGACELQKIYVLKLFHGTGPGSALLKKVIDESSQYGNVLWLSVHENNERAKRFYQKFGFVKTGIDRYRIGSQEFHFCILRRSIESAVQVDAGMYRI